MTLEEENAGLREHLAKWMIANSFATGHGDTIDDLLKESAWQVKEIRDENSKLRERVLQVIRTNNDLVEECTRLAERVEQLEHTVAYKTKSGNLMFEENEELKNKVKELEFHVEKRTKSALTWAKENARLTSELAALKQQPDAGALVSALEDIADNDDEEARNLGLLADIIFTAKQALKKYRGEK